MTESLYLETNFLLSFAYGQNPLTEQLLERIEQRSIPVVMPEVCVTEALSAWRNRRSRLIEVTRGYGDHQREFSRWSGVAAAVGVSNMFRDLPVQLELAQSTARSRLFECLHRLRSLTRFITGDADWLDPSLRSQRTNGLLDDYICSAIFRDRCLSKTPGFFVTENADFHEPSIVADFGSVGVTVWSDPSFALEHYA